MSKSALRSGGKVEIILHAACVKAGTYAIAGGILARLPLAKPFVAKPILASLSKNNPLKIQKQLIRDIYKQHGLKPANWEISAIIAVAESSTQQLVDFSRIERRIKKTLGQTMGNWLLKIAPLTQWAPEIISVVAKTWAIGRYADSVGRIRKLGSDWLPAPLAKNLKLPADLLWNWTEEAFELAMPILSRLQSASNRLKPR
jgi:uncharacterized protein YneF (UPF0154 family)